MNAVVIEGEAPVYDAYPLDIPVLIKLFGVGFIAGALGWLLYLAIAHYFIDPVFCQNASTYTVCRSGGTIAWVSAHIIVLAAAVAVLARFAVYRPLLVVLGVLAALWGAHAWLGAMPWYLGLGWQALLFGLAFTVFGWLARMTNFAVTIILFVVLVIIARAVLIAA